MAQLDRLLALMAGDNMGVLALDEGTPARVESAGAVEPRMVTRSPLTARQIVSLLREVAPPESIQHLDRGAPAAFTYVSSEGVFATVAEVNGGRWNARLSAQPVPALPLIVDAPSTPAATRPNGVEITAVDPAHERIDALLRA